MKSFTVSSSPIITGIITTLCLVLAGSLITSLFLQFSSISENSMPYFTYTVNGISLLVGGFWAGKKGGQKGWYFGGLTGATYFLVIVLIGYLAFDVAPMLNSLIYLAFSFVVGATGGIVGVNMAKK
ncbi:TIGR04086 family membrane protein [Ammoniphilus resinae]|uniref:Membrane protein (TIGR04086 family) n=1 Tax=Ammoniphilus resinae TaxID=861532 RepID=A0ABS4GJK0_9BACL|nr:TIGR04086 family membrane protein [Ammoniphilus resinae]MBP1930438.1 putative membrane protein (TIGR04086 family) [Ammoniphilus resinae]